jgi:hypothetical protein
VAYQSLDPIDLSTAAVGDSYTALPSGQYEGVSQVLLTNNSGFAFNISASSMGELPPLSAYSSAAYNAPPNGGALTATISGGQPGNQPPVQLGLMLAFGTSNFEGVSQAVGSVNIGSEVNITGNVTVDSITGTVDANITNASIPVTGTVDANITNATLTVDGTVSLTAGQVVEVTNQAGGSLTVAGSVDANISNATIDVSGSTVTIGPGLVSYVSLADPAAGSDWAYVFSSTLRLTAVRAILTTSSTQGQRLPYLWQVVGGDTLPTEETMLTPDPIVAGEQIVMTAALGAGPITRSMSHVLATGIAPTAAGIVYQPPSPARTRHVRLVLHNTTGAAIDCIVTTGFGSLVAHVTVAVDPTPPTIIDIEPLITGDSISLEASATGLNYIVYGTDMIDNRRVTSFTGLLMGAQSSVQSATHGLLAGDQWSDIQLAFTGN